MIHRYRKERDCDFRGSLFLTSIAIVLHLIEIYSVVKWLAVSIVLVVIAYEVYVFIKNDQSTINLYKKMKKNVFLTPKSLDELRAKIEGDQCLTEKQKIKIYNLIGIDRERVNLIHQNERALK